jgi:REP element-mobilizing transposase RayT
MDDHVHVVVTPKPKWPLAKIVHTWKSYTAHQTNKRLGRSGPVWLDESYDRIIRSDSDLYEKLTYILNNPRERWPDIQEYPYLWVRGVTTPSTGESPVPPS